MNWTLKFGHFKLLSWYNSKGVLMVQNENWKLEDARKTTEIEK